MPAGPPLDLAGEAHAAGAYVDPSDPQLRQLAGVTGVIKRAMPPYLVGWAAELTAEYAVDHLASWRGLDRQAAVDLLKRAPDRSRDRAAGKGSVVHAALEAHGRGRPPHEVYDAGALPHIQAALGFLQEWQPRFVWVEATVFHPELGYGGTLDFIAELPGLGLVVGDWKTGKGIYAEMGAQLAAYRYASHAVDARHERLPVPEVDGGVIVHLKADASYEVRPVRCGPAEMEAFRHALGINAFKARARGAIGPAQPAPRPPASSPERRRWLVERVRAIVATGSGDLLAERWPAGVPTLRGPGAHTGQQVDAIAAACAQVERLLALPFPCPDPAHPRLAPRVAGDDPRIAALAERLRGLPGDLALAVEAEAVTVRGVPRLSSGRCTEDQLAVVGGLIEHAEGEQRQRASQVAALLAEATAAGADAEAVVRLATDHRHGEPARLGGPEVVLLEALVEALGSSYLGADLAPTEIGTEALVAAWGNRRDALNAAKRAAKARHLRPPRSFAELAADPVLVALALRELTDRSGSVAA